MIFWTIVKIWAVVNFLAIAMRLAYEIAMDCGRRDRDA